MKNFVIGMNLKTTINKKLSSTDEPPNMQCKGEAKLYGPVILIWAIKFHLTCSLLNCKAMMNFPRYGCFLELKSRPLRKHAQSFTVKSNIENLVVNLITSQRQTFEKLQDHLYHKAAYN